MTDNPSFIEVQKYLAGVDYPRGRDELVSAAEANGAPEEVLAALRNIPAHEYDAPTEVTSAVANNS